MVTAATIARNGYFPRELPPPFNTRSFGQLVNAKRAQFPVEYDATSPFKSVCCSHNLARPGSLRRQLRLPNPVNFLALTEQLQADWSALAAHYSTSSFSLSSPDLAVSKLRGRAIGRKFGLEELPTHRARVRAGARYIVSADISLFYPSLYTHSIPWALNTKPMAKAAFASKTLYTLAGNALDTLVRRCQGNQSVGVPIGPDTSLAIAEAILTAVDNLLAKSAPPKGFRYMDDYEFGCATYSEAEEVLKNLQGALGEYELQLNPSKTAITELPAEIELAAIAELRVFPFDGGAGKGQHFDLIRYFNRAFELAKTAKRESVLRYAVARMNGETIDLTNWPIYQDLLLQCATSEPGTLPFALDQLKFYADKGYGVDKSRLSEALSAVVAEHSRRGHGSEVAWAIWGSILLEAPIDSKSTAQLGSIEDNVVALLALHAHSLNLLGTSFSPATLAALMTTQELSGENWLLAYEANVQGWLSGVGGDNVNACPPFQWLKSQGVRFYDSSVKATYTPKKATMYLGGGGGGGVGASA